MESIVAQIQALSGAADIQQLADTLKKAEDTISGNAGLIDSAIMSLDSRQHALGVLYLLHAKAKELGADANSVLSFCIQCQTFLQSCQREQIVLAPEKFAAVCRRFAQACIAHNMPKRAVRSLHMAVEAFRPTPEHLTPVHADLMQVCLLSKCYSAAEPVINQDVFDIDPQKTALTPRDLLLYYYYGGMVLVGLKRYQDAMDFFQMAVTCPASVLSSIALEAYKKFVLVSLLAVGQMVPPPKYTSAAVSRHLKAAAAPYHELAAAYANGSGAEVQQVVVTHQQTFARDNNVGLVKQCVASVVRRGVQKLTQTYLTLSLDDIAALVKLPGKAEAERQVLRMIEAGEVQATIDQQHGMVSFQESSAGGAGEAGAPSPAAMERRIEEAAQLARRLQRVYETIISDPSYIAKVSSRERGARSGAPYDADETGFDSVFDRPFISDPQGGPGGRPDAILDSLRSAMSSGSR
eukprot:tig00001374_g8504.t1